MISYNKEILIILVKQLIPKAVDIRLDNPFVIYHDQTGFINWRDEMFDTLTEEDLKSFYETLFKQIYNENT